MKLRSVFVAAMLALVLAACGGSDGDTDQIVADAQATADQVQDSVDDTLEEAQDAVNEALEDGELDTDDIDDLADSLEDAQDSLGGGGATLTVGDETWAFDSLLCAFGEDEIGQEGAEFVVSSIKDGLQFYVSIDSFGHSVGLNDIEDFANPSVALDSGFGAGEFIELDGKDFGGTVDFLDDVNGTTTEGTFSGTCP